jgi:hypothetical protein
MRQEPYPQGDVRGIQVREIQPEWLRAAVRMIETGSIESAPVVQLAELREEIRQKQEALDELRAQPSEPSEPEPESA